MTNGRDAESPNDACVVAAVRTPLCRARKGALAEVPPSTLLATVLREVVRRAPGVEAGDVDDVCVGNVLSPASGAAAARMACFQAGLPHTVSLSTCNRQCSSGLQAVAHAAHAIAFGSCAVAVGAGVESMSAHPMNKMSPPDVDFEVMADTPGAMDCLIPMGVTSENVSRKYGLKREDLDAFAARSHQRAHRARAEGRFVDEIVPVRLSDGVTVVSEDDGIRPDTTVETLSRLKPVFDPERGSTTAGNSSQMTDGAAAVLLMSRAEARRRGVPVLATFLAYDVVGVPPAVMGIGPAYAVPRAMERAGVSKDEVALYEINEAFASQASWCVSELDLPIDRVNVNGGAVAIGHPLGCTGARQIVTLLHEATRRRRRPGPKGKEDEGRPYGVVSMCIGTGMGAAAVLRLEENAPSFRAPRSSL